MIETSDSEYAALARRVAAGPQLAGSPRLQAFFLYIMDCYLRQKPEGATEQQIGIHVFGRRPGYSSGDDSIVRSQARLLRAKLAVYFANEGSGEPITIEIPKGHYLPVLQERAEHADVLAGNPFGNPPVPAVLDGALEAHPRRQRATTHRRPLLLLAAALLVVVGLGAGLWVRSSGRKTVPTPAGKADPLWALFMNSNRRTLVIYSNPVFFGDPYSGLSLRPPTPRQSSSAPADETYTGTGEVGAIYALTRFFDENAAAFTLKRSQLVTWDEARSSNLIFIGAPSQNTAAHDLPPLSQFAIEVDAQHRGYIADWHPVGKEPARFPYGDASQETAIVALLPGLEMGARMLIFSGLTTVGTQAAVEYACRLENTAALWAQVRNGDGRIEPFEAVLHVDISKGVGVSVQVLAVHRH